MKRVRAVILGLLAGVAVAAAAPALGEQSPIDINTANEAELVVVNGIGPSKARAIVAYRDEHGAFASVDDLREVSGIGDKLLERLRPQVTAGGAAQRETD